ncbi:MAG: nucleotidyltransferase family protein [Calditrichaeota bacterium]|nr:MAG: nucleotidyltransferase family protein [Calditrichota bacterium]
MKQAMILAAGVGSRLKPLTEKLPKALVPFHGVPMLEWLILKLKRYGYTRLIINVHHHAEHILSFIREKESFGVTISFSHENTLLDTGGALKQAIPHFDTSAPLLVHNADIISDIPFDVMESYHRQQHADVTLAVNQRTSSRYLRFTSAGQLCGWENPATGATLGQCPEAFMRRAFCGIHILNPDVWTHFPNEKVFSIIPFYIGYARSHSVSGFDTGDRLWADIGTVSKWRTAQKIFPEKYLKTHI